MSEQGDAIIKAKSFDIPTRTLHFDDTARDTTTTRPAMNRASLSHNDAYEKQRPPIYTHRSFTQSVSSFSLYSHFAGEKFTHKKHSFDDRRLKRNSFHSFRDKKSSNEDDENQSTSIDEEIEEPTTPKASVGKAMFMFLKAFIGSGVLFLPKA